jgi:predicted dithiol-disulfide oxidoreductase (DUF899 family)
MPKIKTVHGIEARRVVSPAIWLAARKKLLMNTTYNVLDLTAKGRDENPERPQDWVRYHDKYRGASRK